MPQTRFIRALAETPATLTVVDPGRAGQHGAADGAGPEDGGVPARPQPQQDAHHLGRDGLQGQSELEHLFALNSLENCCSGQEHPWH